MPTARVFVQVLLHPERFFAALAAGEVRELTAGRTDVAVVLGADLAAAWPGHRGDAVPHVRGPA